MRITRIKFFSSNFGIKLKYKCQLVNISGETAGEQQTTHDQGSKEGSEGKGGLLDN